jgi:hypothetical protein
MDANKDGKVTKGEFLAMGARFDALDRSHSVTENNVKIA